MRTFQVPLNTVPHPDPPTAFPLLPPQDGQSLPISTTAIVCNQGLPSNHQYLDDSDPFRSFLRSENNALRLQSELLVREIPEIDTFWARYLGLREETSRTIQNKLPDDQSTRSLYNFRVTRDLLYLRSISHPPGMNISLLFSLILGSQFSHIMIDAHSFILDSFAPPHSGLDPTVAALEVFEWDRYKCAALVDLIRTSLPNPKLPLNMYFLLDGPPIPGPNAPYYPSPCENPRHWPAAIDANPGFTYLPYPNFCIHREHMTIIPSLHLTETSGF